MMETRVFGRTGIRLSVLGFACGAVGGLMVRGDPRDQERTIARAIDVGVNYFDTAVQYGNGESEKNLGRILQNLKPSNAVVGTKVRLPSAKFSSIADTVATSLEALQNVRLWHKADIRPNQEIARPRGRRLWNHGRMIFERVCQCPQQKQHDRQVNQQL
jgi:aryl-alcohol dehydrogenase-like predicted oxidoreductase